jgi:hypothetical protein
LVEGAVRHEFSCDAQSVAVGVADPLELVVGVGLPLRVLDEVDVTNGL